MLFFKKKIYHNLPDAVRNASACRELHLKGLDYNLKPHGAEFLKFSKVTTLYIHANFTIYDMEGFELPPEIGQMQSLRYLSLLNLPLKEFPVWLTQLSRLEFLLLRGTDITVVPVSLEGMRSLQTLRIENCPLQEIPPGLNKLRKVEKLGLSNTRLKTLHPGQLPYGIRELDLTGTAIYDQETHAQLRKFFTNTVIHPWMP